MTDRIKVFHLEDYKIIRDGIRFLLTQDKTIEVVGEAKNSDELIQLLPLSGANILLMDLYLDGLNDFRTMDGFGVCEYVAKTYPEIKMVIHSVYSDTDRVAKVMNAGAMGYVSKKAGYEELLTAIKSVHGGKKYICKETSKKLKNLNEFLEGIVGTLRGEKDLFSQREKDVLELLGRGFSTKNIAKELFITEKTVETHRKNMIEKASVKNTAELMTFASSRGFLKH